MKYNALLSIGLCFIITACDSEQKTTEQKLATHKIAHPLAKDTHYSHEYVAEIHSVKYVEVRSRVKGYLEHSYVDEGHSVKQGQLLFALNSAEFEKELQKSHAAHKSAIADLKAAEVDLGNVRHLVEKNIVAKTEFAVSEAKVAALRSDVEEAKANTEQIALQLEFTKIKAPYNGTINRIPNKVGSLIAEGDMLTSISNNHEVFAYFNLSEADYLDYVDDNKPIETVSLLLANNSLYPEQGKIEMIESEFDKNTGNIAFRARFSNPNNVLKHGSHGKIIIRHEIENALLIPQKSTFEIQDKLYVFVVKPDGTVKQQNIIPKLALKDFYVVESGLSAQDNIVFEGVETMKDGIKIQAVPVDLVKEMPESDF
ncbi:MAG: efflux RND transporter periplasmic adaptor subunit [Methylococcales bacterium]|nr:efflux RND transporter periplasmic adaptor subunit [Methylococcales bacterium]